MLRPSRADFAKKQVPLFLFLSLLLVSTACQLMKTAPDTHAADETALKNADNEWSKAAGAKDVDKTVSYYSDDATVMPPNSPVVTSKQAIRELWKGMLAPGSSVSWKATKVDIAKSGDLGYLSGTYETTENDARGKPMTDKGKYVEVWKKQGDGSWKCVADIFNSDLAANAPAKKPSLSKRLR